jgi:succinyl-CoA synthetase beta subunit
MDIHEYQAKEILSEFGVPVPRGGLAYSPEQAAYRAREIGGERWVVKAQIHAGGRGKAGGIKLCRDEHRSGRRRRAFGQAPRHAPDGTAR